MDRSLDEVISERQRSRPRGGRRGGRYDDRPRDSARKVATPPAPFHPRPASHIRCVTSAVASPSFDQPPNRDESRDLDKDDWVHDRYEDDRFPERDTRGSRDRRNDRIDRYEPRSDSSAEPPAKLRVDNLHYDLTETDLRELFTRIGPITTITILYDRSDRSRGTAYVTYASQRDAQRAIREFDGANAYGQPIKLTLMPSGPAGGRGGGGLGARVEGAPGRSLFDRIENGRGAAGTRRGRSESPVRDRRREMLMEDVPEGIDRYVPGANRPRPPRSRSPLPARRSGRGGGGAGGSRSQDGARSRGRDKDGRPIVQGRPRKTAEELDAEMENYWGGGTATDASGNVGMANANGSGVAAAPVPAASAPDDDIDMIT